MSRLRLAAAAAVVLVTAGCSYAGVPGKEPPADCQDGFCSTVGYWPSTGQQIENGVVAVLSAIGLAPIVPRSAGGPARRTGRL